MKSNAALSFKLRGLFFNMLLTVFCGQIVEKVLNQRWSSLAILTIFRYHGVWRLMYIGCGLISRWLCPEDIFHKVQEAKYLAGFCLF